MEQMSLKDVAALLNVKAYRVEYLLAHGLCLSQTSNLWSSRFRSRGRANYSRLASKSPNGGEAQKSAGL